MTYKTLHRKNKDWVTLRLNSDVSEWKAVPVTQVLSGYPSEYVRGQFQPVNGEPNHDGDHKTFEETASI
jgi:hypothetical protein